MVCRVCGRSGNCLMTCCCPRWPAVNGKEIAVALQRWLTVVKWAKAGVHGKPDGKSASAAVRTGGGSTPDEEYDLPPLTRTRVGTPAAVTRRAGITAPSGSGPVYSPVDCFAAICAAATRKRVRRQRGHRPPQGLAYYAALRSPHSWHKLTLGRAPIRLEKRPDFSERAVTETVWGFNMSRSAKPQKYAVSARCRSYSRRAVPWVWRCYTSSSHAHLRAAALCSSQRTPCQCRALRSVRSGLPLPTPCTWRPWPWFAENTCLSPRRTFRAPASLSAGWIVIESTTRMGRRRW